MKPILIILHVVFCIALILIVLLQKGKGASMGAVFGGSSQTVFGSAGAASLLHKITTVVAIVFMLTSLGLSIFFGRTSTSSVMDAVEQTGAPVAERSEAPAQTGEAQGNR